MKYTHGMPVTCKIKDEEIKEIKDARISIDTDGKIFICQNLADGLDAEDKLGYKYSWTQNSGYVTDLKPAEITWDNLQEGDEIENGYGEVYTVLGICGKIIFLSEPYDQEACGSLYTAKELLKLGYTIVQPTPPEPEIKEITLDEVAEKFGIDVKNIRIKE